MAGQRSHIQNKVYHKCGICKKILLLDADKIKDHADKAHNIRLAVYSSQHLMDC